MLIPSDWTRDFDWPDAAQKPEPQPQEIAGYAAGRTPARDALVPCPPGPANGPNGPGRANR